MFRHLAGLRERPLPDLEPLRQAWADRTVRPVAESGSAAALAPAADFGLRGRNYYAIARNPPYWHCVPGSIPDLLLRPQVGEKLAAIDARLALEGVRLFLHDAWRPRAVQAYFHDVWFPAHLRKSQPDLSEAELALEVRKYWSPPSRAGAPAPHSTGGAVDVALVWQDDGEPLFMGSLFDDGSPLSHLDHFELEGPWPSCSSHAEARANRRLLYWVMTQEGFCPQPHEWWHFSYGDAAWARYVGAAEALFGAARED